MSLWRSCHEKGIGVFVKTGLGRGKLTPKVLTQVTPEDGTLSLPVCLPARPPACLPACLPAPLPPSLLLAFVDSSPHKVLTQVDSLQGEEKRKIDALLELCNRDGDLLMALAIQFLHGTAGVSSVLLGSKSLQVRAQRAPLTSVPTPSAR